MCLKIFDNLRKLIIPILLIGLIHCSEDHNSEDVSLGQTLDVSQFKEIVKNLGWNISLLEEELNNYNISNFLPESVHEHEPHGVKVASWKWNYVKEPLVLTCFLIVIAIFKLAYHYTRFTKKLLPESCCLIIVGILLGFAFVSDSTHESVKFMEFNSKTFFFFLLPPIILESAYSLKDSAFIENFGTIVLYAVVGTVLNIAFITLFHIFMVAIGAYGLFNLTILDIIVFSSLIAAVDPVAVLAVFQEVGVNKMLYFMVFGESLLNDAVTIVCYNLANEFKELPEFDIIDCLTGVLAFLFVSLGGLIIGLVCGIASTFVTKYTDKVRIVEPVILCGGAYLGYIGSELFHFSGIIGMIACGLFQGHYARENVSYKSWSSVQYLTKVTSSCSESLIFIILGVMLINEREWFWQDWHPMFSLCSVIVCVVVRFGVTFFLTYVVNKFTGGVRHISIREQVIMAYGGLRGAVSFSLAFMITSSAETKNTILAATYLVILFTVFVQGATIKVLVKIFNIRLAKTEDSFRLFREFNSGMIENLSQGIEDLCGYKNYNWAHRLSVFSKKYIRPLIQKNYAEQARKERKLVNLDRAISMRDAINRTPSQCSFSRQQTMDEMAESGVPMDLFDDDHHPVVIRPSKADIEERTEELTKDISSIRQLMSGSECYVDRNLTHEEENDQKGDKYMTGLQTKKRMMSAVQRTKSKYFGKKRSVRANATQQGLIHSAIATLGVHSVSDQSTSSGTVHVENEEEGEGLRMTSADSENHPLVTISEGAETSF